MVLFLTVALLLVGPLRLCKRLVTPSRFVSPGNAAAAAERGVFCRRSFFLFALRLSGHTHIKKKKKDILNRNNRHSMQMEAESQPSIRFLSLLPPALRVRCVSLLEPSDQVHCRATKSKGKQTLTPTDNVEFNSPQTTKQKRANEVQVQ